MVLLWLWLGCVPRYELVGLDAPIPAGVWTTRPLPCEYREVARIYQEGWSAEEAQAPLLAYLSEKRADALVDYKADLRPVVIPGRQYREAGEGGTARLEGYVVKLYSAEALAVRWVGDCPLAPVAR